MKDIKDYRDKELKWFVVGVGLLYLYLNCFDKKLDNKQLDYINCLLNVLATGVISSCIYTIVFVIDSVVPSNVKEYIITIFGMIPLRGNNVFNKIRNKNSDKRFSKQDALLKYSEVYDNMPNNKKESRRYQNKEWYKIYSKHRDKVMIIVSNRDYLLCRDLSIVTLITCVVYGIGCICALLTFYWLHFGFLIGILIMSIIATHIKASRFVYNVIAIDIYGQD